MGDPKEIGMNMEIKTRRNVEWIYMNYKCIYMKYKLYALPNATGDLTN